MKKPIPKSLHTVTVLVAMATIYRDMGYSVQGSIDRTLSALGYDILQDDYKLAEQALHKLNKKG